MPEDEAAPAEERLRRVLGELGSDQSSAPEVPPAVTDRIRAALRAAPPPPAHATSTGRVRWVALAIGVCAAVVAVAVAVALLSRPAPAPRFPSGPTAEKMTVPAPPVDTPAPAVRRP